MGYPYKIRKLYSLLFPTGRAWQYTRDSEDREGIIEPYTDGVGNVYTDGIGQPYGTVTPQFIATDGKRFTDAKLKAYDRAYSDTKNILNTILPDNDQFNDVDADRWEKSLLLIQNLTDLSDRKMRINRRLNYPKGIVERSHYQFIQKQIRADGFDVYITENRFWTGTEYEVIDPEIIGTQQMESGLPESGIYESAGEIPGTDYTSIIANYVDENIDNGFFTAPVVSPVESGTIESGTSESDGGGTVILDRDIQLQASFFIGGPTFPSIIDLPVNRQVEFRQLVLKLKPTQTLCFEYINYI